MSPRGRECPNCEMSFSGRKCPRCQWEPERAAKGEATVDLCGWESSEPCVFLASIWPTDAGRDAKGRNLRPGFCGWHFETLQNPRLGQEYEEFERWVKIRRERYCTQFSHHPTSYLWDTLQGPSRPADARYVAQPCRQGDCWVWGTLEQAKLASPYIPPRGSRRAWSFAELARGLSRPGAEHLGNIISRAVPGL